jgi:TPR repeat protein
MFKLIRTGTFLLCTAVATPAMAQDIDKGMAAYNAGDYDAALQEWRPLAEQGDAEAQTYLGVMYNVGNGMIKDYAEAVDWYRKAAEQGHADAQFNLSTMYKNGYGVIQDAVIEHMWINISGANGHFAASIARDEIEQRMTRGQIAEAQSLARRCMASDYQDCG